MGPRVGSVGSHVGSALLFRYQHVGIGNANSLRWGYRPTQHTDASGFCSGIYAHIYAGKDKKTEVVQCLTRVNQRLTKVSCPISIQTNLCKGTSINIFILTVLAS